jgi:hypothetical protein
VSAYFTVCEAKRKVTGYPQYSLMARIEVLREQVQTLNGPFTGSLSRLSTLLSLCSAWIGTSGTGLPRPGRNGS